MNTFCDLKRRVLFSMRQCMHSSTGTKLVKELLECRDSARIPFVRRHGYEYLGEHFTKHTVNGLLLPKRAFCREQWLNLERTTCLKLRDPFPNIARTVIANLHVLAIQNLNCVDHIALTRAKRKATLERLSERVVCSPLVGWPAYPKSKEMPTPARISV